MDWRIEKLCSVLWLMGRFGYAETVEDLAMGPQDVILQFVAFRAIRED